MILLWGYKDHVDLPSSWVFLHVLLLVPFTKQNEAASGAADPHAPAPQCRPHPGNCWRAPPGLSCRLRLRGSRVATPCLLVLAVCGPCFWVKPHRLVAWSCLSVARFSVSSWLFLLQTHVFNKVFLWRDVRKCPFLSTVVWMSLCCRHRAISNHRLERSLLPFSRQLSPTMG